MIYIKARSDYRTRRQAKEISYVLCTESFDEEASQAVLKRGGADQDDAGAWALWTDGGCSGLFVIESVTPEEDRARLTLADPLKIFDRDVWFTGAMASASTTAALIEAVIRSEWIGNTDEAYACPYLTIVNELGTTDPVLIKPREVKAAEGDGSGGPVLFNVCAYFRMLRDAYRIDVVLSDSRRAVICRIAKRTEAAHNVPFGDGHAILVAQSFGGADTVAKVSVIQKVLNASAYGRYDYYLTEDGDMSEEDAPPETRAPGRWSVITVGEPEEETAAAYKSLRRDEAARQFGENSGGLRIEFWSDREYSLGDVLTMRLNGKRVKGRVAVIRRRSDNARWFYRVGDLATSLTDKLKKKG